MMKKQIVLSVAAALVLSFGFSAPVAALAEDETELNLFASRSDWMHSQGKGEISFNDSGLTLTPIDTVGSAYIVNKMGQGKIRFTYQVEYAEGVDAFKSDADNYQTFFGVLFSNSPADVVTPNGSLSIPWDAPGGYPYMVAFDTEVQGNEPDRAKQVGLTLRRYRAGGSHDYTRWSSVEPKEATYINTSGVQYESKVPDFYKPVTLEQCYDTTEHTVEIGVKNLYKANGDEKDAVKIDVTFDGELCLTVIDEMPFEGEDLGETIELDKRDADGYIALYAYDGFNTNDLSMWDFKVHVKSFSAVFGESNEGAPKPGGSSDTEGGCKGGCKGSAAGLSALVVLSGVALASVFSKRRK